MPQHNQHWVTKRVTDEAQVRMSRYGVPIEVTPSEALLGCLAISVGHTVWLRAKIDSPAFDDLDRFEARAWIKIYDAERDRLAKIAKAALDVGVAEKHVKAIESIGVAVANLLKLVFADEDLALNATQKERLPEVLRRHLPAITGDAFELKRTLDDDYEEWDDEELVDELQEREVEFSEQASRARLIYLLREDDALYAQAQNGR